MLKKIISVVLFALLLALACGACAEEEFSLRGGVKFGMLPDEVIAIEASNGFRHDLTSKGEVLYLSTMSNNYQLYFQDNPLGAVGEMPIFRFEYDFDLAHQKMYQFYYVFKAEGAFSYLESGLYHKYGQPSNDPAYGTDMFLSSGAETCTHHSRWTLAYGEQIVAIDLWDNNYGVCFLAYQDCSEGDAMEELESLLFGL